VAVDADVVIVGGGPAGLSAATWLARYRRTVLVLDSGEYRNRWVQDMHGYLGADPSSPDVFRERALAGLSQYDTVRVLPARATAASADADGFRFALEGGADVSGRRVILATGVVDEFPDVPGFFDHYGSRVFHCPSCDGYEALDQPVVVFGWDEHVPGFAAGLLEWASSVTVVTDGRPFAGHELHQRALERLGIPVVTDEVVELCGSPGDLRAVRLRDGGVIPASYAFFSIAHKPRTELAEQLGCDITGESCLGVDHEGRTNVAGVYAAGDVTPGMQYVQVAAAKGAMAGTSAALALRDAALGGHTGPHDRP
jgi:thioredoxin reductase